MPPATPRRGRRLCGSRAVPVRGRRRVSSNVEPVRWVISGGAGFLGLHLARRLVADGHEVRTLDLAPLDDAELERGVEELRGDVRSVRDARALVKGARILVHAAAALPIQVSRDSIRSVNVAGTATLLAAAAEAGVKRVVLVSST